MRRSPDDLERKQQVVVMSYRQSALFWLAISSLALWALPHPYLGEYTVRIGDALQQLGFDPTLEFLRLACGVVAVVAALVYLLAPAYVRSRWRRWYPLGY